MKGGLPMLTIDGLIGLFGLCLDFLMLGYALGRNSQK